MADKDLHALFLHQLKDTYYAENAILKALPKIKPEPEDDGEKKTKSKMSAGEYEQKQEERLIKAIEDAADGVEEREGDADLWLEKFERRIHKMRESRRKTAPARRSWIMPGEDEDEEAREQGGRTANTCITPEVSEGPDEAAEGVSLGIKNDTQGFAEMPEKTHDFDPSEGEKEAESDALPFALNIVRQGIAVFPVFGCADGVCFCPDGSECRSAGKHPIPTLVPRGVKNATTDEATIRR